MSILIFDMEMGSGIFFFFFPYVPSLLIQEGISYYTSQHLHLMGGLGTGRVLSDTQNYCNVVGPTLVCMYRCLSQ